MGFERIKCIKRIDVINDFENKTYLRIINHSAKILEVMQLLKLLFISTYSLEHFDRIFGKQCKDKHVYHYE